MEGGLSKTKDTECQVLANRALVSKKPSHSTEPPRKAAGSEDAYVWQERVKARGRNQEDDMKVCITYTEMPRFAPPPHLSRPLSFPQPASIPEGFYSMEKLRGSYPGGRPRRNG